MENKGKKPITITSTITRKAGPFPPTGPAFFVIVLVIVIGFFAFALALLLGCASLLAETTIRIDSTRRLNAISPLLYGHFVEFMFEDVKGGLWAELIRNRGFENTAPNPSIAHYWERYPDTRIDDSIAFKGERFGVTEDGYPTTYKNRSQIIVSTFPLQPHGIYQDNIPVRAGITYRGVIRLRGKNLVGEGKSACGEGKYTGKVRVTLEENTTDGAVYACSEIEAVPEDWRRFEFLLPTSRTDPQARFTIQVLGRGMVWVDQVSLMPGDAVGGVRADVLDKIKGLKPAFVRWPGGNVAQDYHWEWGIGPIDDRPVWVNMSWFDDPEPADFGTPEYLAFCQAIGAEPTIVVNVEGRGATVNEAKGLLADGKDPKRDSRAATAQDAANWVEYCNGPATSKYGALRARDGHPEPFRVRYWEIGNEIWGDWVRGHSDARTYAANAKRYIQAMKAVDPSIKIIAIGDNDMDWNREVVQAIGDQIDYLAVHHYYGFGEMKGDVKNLFARPLRYSRFYDDLRKKLKEWAPRRSVQLAINEWNTWIPLPREHSMESGLYGARLMNVFERHGDLIGMSAVSDLVNGWIGGIIQASRHRVFTTPTYSIIKAYNEHRGSWRVPAALDTDLVYDPSDKNLGSRIPALDVVATTDESGLRIYLKVVNTEVGQPVAAKIELSTGTKGIRPQAKVVTINGAELATANSFSRPDDVRVRESAISDAAGSFTYTFEPHSVTIIAIELF